MHYQENIDLPQTPTQFNSKDEGRLKWNTSELVCEFGPNLLLKNYINGIKIFRIMFNNLD